MKTLFLSTLITLFILCSGYAQIGNYRVEEMNISETTSAKPFTITNIQQQSGELWLWISAGNISNVAGLLSRGAFETQSSLGEDISTPALSLWKRVSCTDAEKIKKWSSDLRYSASLSADCTVTSTQYYFRTPVILGNGRDFGIGLSPDFLWLIERR